MSYTGGSITLDQGLNAFEIATGNLLTNVQPGDYLEIDGVIGTVATIDSSTTGTLVLPWAGESKADYADYLFNSTKASVAIQLVFDSEITDSDPGDGRLRFDDTVSNTVAWIYISDEDRFANIIREWVDALGNSSSDVKGRLRLVSTDNPSRWAEFDVTDVPTDDTGYKKIPVTSVLITDQFDNDEVLTLFFSPTGDKGETGTDGADGVDGGAGADGADGVDGVTTALRMVFSTNTADSDPGDGKLKANSNDFTAVTMLYVDNSDGLSSDISDWLDSLDDVDAVIRGTLRIVLSNDQTQWIEFLIDGDITDGVGYRKIPVQYVDHNGTFNLDADISITFARAGKDGTAGADGSDGSDGTDGADGADGVDGEDGNTPALQLLFSTDINDTDPTAGFFKFNHGTMSSVTLIFMDVLDKFTSSIVNWIDALDNSDSDIRGNLRFTRLDDPSYWVEFFINDDIITAGSEYRKIPVQYIASNGEFDDLMEFGVTFSRTGDRGTDGVDGINGTNGADFDVTSLSGTSTSNVEIGTGSKNFATQDGKLWVLGQRLRATSPAGDKVMEGPLTAYSPGSITLNVDLTVGSGFQSEWNITYTGERGQAGVDGNDGFQSGTKLQFSTNTTEEDPGAGFFRLNDADPELADKIFISTVDYIGSDIILWISMLSESTTSSNRGLLRLEVFENPDSFLQYKVISGVIDHTDYWEIPVEFVGAADAFSDLDVTIANFTRTGDKGVDGSGAGDVVGPDGGVTDGHVVVWDTTTGKAIKSAGFYPMPLSYLDTDGTLAANSDVKIASQKAVKTYVDTTASNLQSRSRVRAATTANITIATDLNAGDTIDTVTLAAGNLVLVKDQTNVYENGIYVVGPSPARFGQFDTFDEHPGTLVTVQEGADNADTIWICTSNVGGVIDTNDIVFTEISIFGALLSANNLSDLTDVGAAQVNLNLEMNVDVQAWDADLDALAALAATAGMLSRTGAGAFAVRTLTAPAAGITISNGTGAAGNPTWALANDLAALEGLASTGFSVRTATDTWAQRSVAGTSNEITVTNGDGVSGNPTISLPSTVDLAASDKALTVRDNDFSIKDDGDLTKILQFQLSGITTATTRTLTAPDASGTIALTSDLTSGYQPLDGDLTALAALASTGIIARTASDTYAPRTITGPAAGITVTNGNGVSGNPTLALANDLAALEGLASTGLAVRTASDTWAQRSVAGTASEITVTNGDGVSGNPTISFPSVVNLVTNTRDFYVRGSDTFIFNNAGTQYATFNSESLSAARTFTFPDTSGTLVISSDLTQLTPVGTVTAYGGTAAPTGWLLCYGQNVSRTTYAALFTAIGTTFGVGDGSTTFTLPDLRGRVIAGQDDMGGVSANRLTGLSGGINGDTLGGTGGVESHVLTDAELSSHSHATNPAAVNAANVNIDHNHGFYSVLKTNTSGGGGLDRIDALNTTSGTFEVTDVTGAAGMTAHTHSVDVANTTSTTTGSDTAHNNVQPTIILNYIIYTG